MSFTALAQKVYVTPRANLSMRSSRTCSCLRTVRTRGGRRTSFCSRPTSLSRTEPWSGAKKKAPRKNHKFVSTLASRQLPPLRCLSSKNFLLRRQLLEKTTRRFRGFLAPSSVVGLVTRKRRGSAAKRTTALTCSSGRQSKKPPLLPAAMT